MEYYDVYDQNYIRLAKSEGKVILVKIEVLDYSEYPIYEITDDVIVDSDNFSSTYQQGARAKLSFDIYNNEHKYDTNVDSPFWFDKKIKSESGR